MAAFLAIRISSWRWPLCLTGLAILAAAVAIWLFYRPGPRSVSADPGPDLVQVAQEREPTVFLPVRDRIYRDFFASDQAMQQGIRPIGPNPR
ncbi:MAG: hypothetical protein QHH07_12605 [Sedimentisphaerales bacterium]|nr:hypothetical protein [Sedimentisphaerales bacterium]